MYTSMNKGFTIITNFGCDQHCPYCISKHHPILQNNLTNDINWKYLEKCIAESTAPTVNLSGGGDPFFHYQEHLDFYDHIYNICQKYQKRMDIHTRILPDDNELLSKFRKIALSIEYDNYEALNNLKERFNSIKNIVKIRVIQVVNSKITWQDCLHYIQRLKHIGCEQITFRQMFGNKLAFNHFYELEKIIKYPGVLFLHDGEYHNYYFTTNNKLYPYFFGNLEKDREDWKKIYEHYMATDGCKNI